MPGAEVPPAISPLNLPGGSILGANTRTAMIVGYIAQEERVVCAEAATALD
jgi:hypothetical protein